MYSRSAKQWVIKKIYEKKTNHYASELMKKTLANRMDNTDTAPDGPRRRSFPVSIAPTPAPSNTELLEKRN